jgi:hypothetical protein
VPHTIHDLAHAAGAMAGPAAGAVQWIVKALGGAVVGLFVGGLIVLVVRQLTSRPEDLIVD